MSVVSQSGWVATSLAVSVLEHIRRQRTVTTVALVARRLATAERTSPHNIAIRQKLLAMLAVVLRFVLFIKKTIFADFFYVFLHFLIMKIAVCLCINIIRKIKRAKYVARLLVIMFRNFLWRNAQLLRTQSYRRAVAVRPRNIHNAVATLPVIARNNISRQQRHKMPKM